MILCIPCKQVQKANECCIGNPNEKMIAQFIRRYYEKEFLVIFGVMYICIG